MISFSDAVNEEDVDQDSSEDDGDSVAGSSEEEEDSAGSDESSEEAVVGAGRGTGLHWGENLAVLLVGGRLLGAVVEAAGVVEVNVVQELHAGSCPLEKCATRATTSQTTEEIRCHPFLHTALQGSTFLVLSCGIPWQLL